MEKKQIVARLKRLESELQSLIAEVDGARAEIGVCPWCSLPIYEGQRTVRGVHQSTCYSFAQSRVADGDATWAELEKRGKVLPKGRPGRKKLTADEHRQAQKESGESIAADLKKARARKPRK